MNKLANYGMMAAQKAAAIDRLKSPIEEPKPIVKKACLNCEKTATPNRSFCSAECCRAFRIKKNNVK